MDIVMLNALAELSEIELKKIAAINELMCNYIGALADDDNDSTDSAVILAYVNQLENALKDALAINDKIWNRCYASPVVKYAPPAVKEEGNENEPF